jgi:hypothetical protein
MSYQERQQQIDKEISQYEYGKVCYSIYCEANKDKKALINLLITKKEFQINRKENFWYIRRNYPRKRVKWKLHLL